MLVAGALNLDLHAGNRAAVLVPNGADDDGIRLELAFLGCEGVSCNGDENGRCDRQCQDQSADSERRASCGGEETAGIRNHSSSSSSSSASSSSSDTVRRSSGLVE